MIDMMNAEKFEQGLFHLRYYNLIGEVNDIYTKIIQIITLSVSNQEKLQEIIGVEIHLEELEFGQREKDFLE